MKTALASLALMATLAVATPTCNRLNVSAANVDCQGLLHRNAASEESCAATCCDDATCTVWQWCAGGQGTCYGATGPHPQCWTGAFSDCIVGKQRKMGLI